MLHFRGDSHLPWDTTRLSAQSMGSLVGIHTTILEVPSTEELRIFIRRVAPTLRGTSRCNLTNLRLTNVSKGIACPNMVLQGHAAGQILTGFNFDPSLTSVCRPLVVRVVFS